MTVQPILFMFSGQGCQYFGMGRELFDANATFRYWMTRCSELAEPRLGRPLTDIIYGTERARPFTRTLHTHPAVFATGYSLARMLQDRGVQADACLGYSLGELVAAAVTQVLSLEDAMALVISTAEMIEQRTAQGAMMAVIGPPQLFDRYPAIFDGTVIACRNHEKHFVVSGSRKAIEAAAAQLRALEVLAELLPVSHAFHSPLMGAVEQPIKELWRSLQLTRANGNRIVSALYGRILRATDLTAEYAWALVREPVAFDATIQALAAAQTCTYIDVGTGGTLAGFTRTILGAHSGATVTQVLNPFGRDLATVDSMFRALAEI